MNFLSYTRLKAIFLNREQIRMAHTIIEVNKIYIRYKSEIHKSLAKKVEQAKDRHIKVPAYMVVRVEFSEDELKLMREYNSNYCEILRDKMVAIEEKTGQTDPYGLEAYALATKVQLLFSPFQ